MSYQLPMMTHEHEFRDLAFVARYVDTMIAKTGNQDWGVVYEYPEEDLGDGTDDDDYDIDVEIEDKPPCAVLLRHNGQWHRRLVTSAKFLDGQWLMEFES